MAAVSPFEKLNGAMVFAMCLFMALFSIGIGPLTCTYVHDVPALHVRVHTRNDTPDQNRGTETGGAC